MKEHSRSATYKEASLTLWGAVSMGTGVMIGAGIFALTGQVAELAGSWFPWAFLTAGGVTGFSAYSYVKLANAYPSAGGIAMFLERIFGRGATTAVCALLMFVSMVINESLVARTFGTYVLQLFDLNSDTRLIPILGVALLCFAFLINILSNRWVQAFASVTALLKIGGLVVLAGGGLWASGLSLESVPAPPEETDFTGFLGPWRWPYWPTRGLLPSPTVAGKSKPRTGTSDELSSYL